MFDKENKGFIRATQVGQILRTMGQAFEERDLKQLIKEFDTDGSGEIEFEEFAAMVASFVVEDDNAGLEEELREAFRLYDKEGNGYIAVSDLRDILRALDENVSEEELDEMIAEIDADGSGTVDFDGLKYAAGRPSIGLALFGCKNRPAYRIVVFPHKAYGRHHEDSIIEELGAFDPLPNYRNEKLVACDITRLKYWIGERDAHISPSLLELLVTCFMCCFLFVSCFSGRCREKVDSLFGNSTESKVVHALYEFETDTQKCDAAESVAVLSQAIFCEFSYLNVTFTSVAVLSEGINVLPYVLLNVSISINYPVSSVFLRLECLEAPSLDDDYCHNHERQHQKWGRMIWPCRSLILPNPDLVHYPFFFSYSCFRLSAYSQYRLNVSCAPYQCRKSFIVTIPSETHIHPVINRFYDKSADVGFQTWSPLVSVDLTLKDRIIIYYEKHPNLTNTVVSVALYERTTFLFSHLFTDTFEPLSVEYEWKNVPAGNYTAYLFVNRMDCDVTCNSGLDHENKKCNICPSTEVHFTVDKDKTWIFLSGHSLTWGALIIGSLIIFLKCAAALSFGIVVAIMVIRFHQKDALYEVSLSQRTTVFIVYSDDSELHTSCIARLAELLQRYANVDVFIDLFELKYSDSIPLRWFIDKFTMAGHVIFIFSEGANAILRGKVLIQRQPFPEFFSTAINFLVTEYYKTVTEQPLKVPAKASVRFAFAYMTYSQSSVIPLELTVLPITVFKLPDQVRNLISWLHNQRSDIPVDVSIDISNLKKAVKEVLEYQRNNPFWLTERLQSKQKNNEVVFEPQNIPFEEVSPILTAKEQVVISKSLNLEPPDNQLSENVASREDVRFSLLGSPDDSSDSISSLSDKIDLQLLLVKSD
ncbi:unnamed protein product [Thelazia callipaeda]|uniref:Small ribosomal subunit protein bS16m n=1 Tax=Thelazia callipaeda TaxID=103827 RepID=A0A0N5CXB9_THECL|nr:unnamed protein product [Thelazia callipaeda]